MTKTMLSKNAKMFTYIDTAFTYNCNGCGTSIVIDEKTILHRYTRDYIVYEKAFAQNVFRFALDEKDCSNQIEIVDDIMSEPLTGDLYCFSCIEKQCQIVLDILSNLNMQQQVNFL